MRHAPGPRNGGFILFADTAARPRPGPKIQDTALTNRIAVALALLIAAVIAADLALGYGGTLFVLRKAYVFLDWVMFWR